MKTFIWNREYEVIAVNAETVEQARELASPKLDELLNPRLEREIENSIKYLKETDPAKEDPNFYRDKDWWDSNIEYIKNSIIEDKKLIYEDPEEIIEENQAIIFSHTNA